MLLLTYRDISSRHTIRCARTRRGRWLRIDWLNCVGESTGKRGARGRCNWEVCKIMCTVDQPLNDKQMACGGLIHRDCVRELSLGQRKESRAARSFRVLWSWLGSLFLKRAQRNDLVTDDNQIIVRRSVDTPPFGSCSSHSRDLLWGSDRDNRCQQRDAFHLLASCISQ